MPIKIKKGYTNIVDPDKSDFGNLWESIKDSPNLDELTRQMTNDIANGINKKILDDLVDLGNSSGMSSYYSYDSNKNYKNVYTPKRYTYDDYWVVDDFDKRADKYTNVWKESKVNDLWKF